MSARAPSRGALLAQRALVLVALGFFLAPLAWLALTALKPASVVNDAPPNFLAVPTLENFRAIFDRFEPLLLLRNSVVVSAGTAVVALALGVPAGYALARSRRRWAIGVAYFFLFVRMVPPVAALIPFYLLMRDLRLLGTYPALIAINVSLNAAFVVWMMFSYFRDVPIEVEDAARVDGCNRWQAFWRAAVPLARPGIVASGLFCVLLSWNDFLFALMLSSPETATLPVGMLATFSSQDINLGQLAAFSQIATLPIVLLALFLNRYFVQGLVRGAH